MKTALIWDDMQGALEFYVFKGDYRHLDKVYVNGSEDFEKVDELSTLLYDEEGDKIVDQVTIQVFCEAVHDGAFPIVCGMVP